VRRRHEPTEQQRVEAQAYAAVGVPHHDISKLLGIDTKTLLKYYRTELDLGKAKANAQVAKKLYAIATGGNLGAMIFWLKAQAGWREVQAVEHTGANGSPLIPPVINLGFTNGGPGNPTKRLK
jgi:hypothetical protein